MIGAMRKNRKILSIILWLVIIAFVSTIFVVWGIGSKENVSMYAATVGDETITYEAYRSAYDQKLAAVRQIFGDDFAAKQNDSSEFSTIVLNDMIDTKLALKEANRLKIPATNFEMITTIRDIPAFQKDGYFDPETYKEVLRANRQTPAYFEQTLRDSIKVDKFKKLVTNSQYAVNGDAVMKEYAYRNTKAEVEYFSVPVTNFLDNVTVVQDNLSAYYEKNKENYRIPAKIQLKYLTFDKAKFTDNVTVSDAEIEQYYNNNLASFSQPETLDIRNIAISVKNPEDAKSDAEAKAKIDAALAALKTGAKFTDMVEKYSDAPFKVNGGLIANIQKEQMQKNMIDAISVTKEGEYSDIIKTGDGYLIIYIEKKRPAKVSLLADVKNEIASKLKKDRLAATFRKYVYDLYKDILKAGNITAYMKAKPDSGLRVEETAVFTEGENVLPLFASQPEVKAKIFALNKTDMSQVVSDGETSYFFEVADKTDSFIPLLDVVTNSVEAAYKKSLSAEIALGKVSEAINKDGFDKAVQAFKASVVMTKPFLRNDTGVEFTTYADLISSIFKSKAGETLNKAYLVGDNVYGVKVKAILSPSMDNFGAEKDAIETYIRSVKEEEALKSYIAHLRTKTKVVISPSFTQNLIDEKKK